MLLEMPSVYMSYMTLNNITANTTHYCEAQNTLGKDAKSIQISVHRNPVFDIIQKPEGNSIYKPTTYLPFCTK